MKLYQHQKWYTEDSGEKNYSKKIRLNRRYDTKYIVVKDVKSSVESERICDEKVIDKLLAFKKNANIQNNRFCCGNILFKLPYDYRNNKFKEHNQTKVTLKKRNLNKNWNVKRNDIQENLSDWYRESLSYAKDNDSPFSQLKTIIGDFIEDQSVKINEKSIQVFSDEVDYENSAKQNKVLVYINSDKDIEIKNEIYSKLQEINTQLVKVFKNAFLNDKGNLKPEIFENRKYLVAIDKQLDKQENELTMVCECFKVLKKYCFSENGESKEYIAYILFLLNTKLFTREIFKTKLILFFNGERPIGVSDFKSYLKDLLIETGNAKRIIAPKKASEKFPKNEIESAQIKTYITNDKHVNYNNTLKIDEKKNLITKYLSSTQLEMKIEQILNCYNINVLRGKLSEQINKDSETDTSLFKVFKEHYKKQFQSVNFEEKSSEDKLLFKYVYRYLKGRINKIIENDNYKNSINKYFTEKKLLEKIRIHVKNVMLEHILYLGKIKQYAIEEPTTNEFQKFHCYEELSTELLSFFSSAKLMLHNEFDNVEEDWFGEKLTTDNLKKSGRLSSSSFNFLIGSVVDPLDSIKSYNDTVYELRNKIIHGKHSEWKDITGKTALASYYGILKEHISKNKVTPEEQSKALNLSVVFKGNECRFEKLSNEISSLRNAESLSLYFPSFSKIVPRIKFFLRDMLESDSTIDSEVFIKIETACIFVIKQLYLSQLREGSVYLEQYKGNRGFTNCEAIKIDYQKTQSNCSKGMKQAMRKNYEGKIDLFFSCLKEEYGSLFSFERFKGMSNEEFLKEIRHMNVNPSFVIEASAGSVTIENDLDYVLLMTAELSRSEYVNFIFHRFNASAVWLETLGEKYRDSSECFKKIAGNLATYLTIQSDKAEQFNRESEQEDILKQDMNTILEEMNTILEEMSDIKERASELCACDSNRASFFKYFEKCNQKEFMRDIRNDEVDIDNRTLSPLVGEYYTKKGDYDEKKIVYNKKLERVKQNKQFTKKMNNLFPLKELSGPKNILDTIYQGNSENPIFTFNNGRFAEMEREQFERIYALFIKTDLQEIVRYDLIEWQDGWENVDVVLSNSTLFLKNWNGYYRKHYRNICKYPSLFKELSKGTTIETFDEFKKLYLERNKYMKQKFILEFQHSRLIYQWGIDISWKMAAFVSRFERDMHHFVLGLQELGCDLYEDTNLKRSVAYKCDVGGNHYTWKVGKYDSFIEYAEYFGIAIEDLKRKEGLENIRNYWAHFEWLKNPFEQPLAKKISDLENILVYRTKYNNGVKNAVLQSFKRELRLDYSVINKKISFSGLIKSEEWATNREYSIFGLENKIDYLEFVNGFLTKRKP